MGEVNFLFHSAHSIKSIIKRHISIYGTELHTL